MNRGQGPVAAVAQKLVIEAFGGRYAGEDGWELFKQERPADAAHYRAKARGFVEVVGAALVQTGLGGANHE